MSYKAGLHILAELKSRDAEVFSSSSTCKPFFDEMITRFGLAKVGEVYHDFAGGGFTAVVCLTESHLSIHTWPEYKMATFDIFLSNYKRDNSDIVRGIYSEVLRFFHASEISKTELLR